MTVIELARRAGVSAGVVRHYVRIGLLQPIRNPENGYKLFKSADVERLQYIKAFQDLGLSLKEIAELTRRDLVECSTESEFVVGLLQRRLVETRHKVDELIALSRRICEALVRVATASAVNHGTTDSTQSQAPLALASRRPRATQPCPGWRAQSASCACTTISGTSTQKSLAQEGGS